MATASPSSSAIAACPGETNGRRFLARNAISGGDRGRKHQLSAQASLNMAATVSISSR